MLVLVFGGLLPWLMVGVGSWIVFQLLRQNGRILLRLEQLEREVASLAGSARQGRSSADSASQRPQPTGLAPGVPAPMFELPDLLGARTSLAQFRGRRVLLVFFNPECVFCEQMTPELSALPLEDPRVALPVVVTTGDAAANRRFFKEHKTRCPVLLQRQMDVAARYRANGTPTGYLIDEDGLVASELAIGAEALLSLARQRGSEPTGGESTARNAGSHDRPEGHKTHHGNRTLADSHIIRDGLKAGTPAPEFRLPSLDGREIALSDYRGKRLVMVFSDPHCGPCEQAATALEARYRTVHNTQLLVVSRGDRADNLAKVSEFGLTFPLVLQKQWEISRLYGMFATPIGYLIDERGVICRDVAVGADAILAIYSDASDSSHLAQPPRPQEAIA